MCTYASKKSSSAQRGIGFDLTKEQWDNLIAVRDDRNTRCAYTGVCFIFKVGHKYYPSLERLDDRIGYRVDNCVWVTTESNMIKDRFMDKCTKPREEADPREVTIINALTKKMSESNWKEKMIEAQMSRSTVENVMSSFDEEVKEDIKEATVEVDYKLPMKVLKDLFISTYYNSLVNSAIRNKIQFEITLSQFRSLMLKKTCTISGGVLEFTENNDTQPKVIFKDYSNGYVIGNVIVVSGKTSALLHQARQTFGSDLKSVSKILHTFIELQG